MTTKLKPITETSWLVINDLDETRVGLLSKVRDKYILMARGEKKQFLDRKEVNTFFSENVFDNIVEDKKEEPSGKTYYINGYPVDFDNPHEVLIKGNKLPLFSKKATSEIYYSAGFYCLHFPKNWMPAFCPKLSTLESYEYKGPFSTELEMRTALANVRKEKNLSK